MKAYIELIKCEVCDVITASPVACPEDDKLPDTCGDD